MYTHGNTGVIWHFALSLSPERTSEVPTKPVIVSPSYWYNRLFCKWKREAPEKWKYKTSIGKKWRVYKKVNTHNCQITKPQGQRYQISPSSRAHSTKHVFFLKYENV